MATVPFMSSATAAAVAAISPAFGALLFAQVPSHISDSLRARIDSVFLDVDRTTTPGCALGIYRDGQIAYARGYGMANLELGVPITPHSVFDIGSVSKQFTATAILLLVEEGRLRLDDPVRRYLPELPAFTDPITIQQLLRHTSGLPELHAVELLAGRSFETEITADEVLRGLAAAGQLNFAPGSYWTYNNTGFFLAARLVERVTGEPFEAVLQGRIFGPLSMGTVLRTDFRQLIPNRVTGYRRTPSGAFETASSNYITAGNGHLRTSVEDLAKWDGNFTRPLVGGRALVDSLMAEGTLASGMPTASGYNNGMRTLRTGAYHARGHGGNWVGYTAHYRRYPSAHLGLAALCNITQFELGERVERVARVLLGLPPQDQGTRDSARVAQAAATFSGFWRERRTGVVIRVRHEANGLLPGLKGGRPLVLLAADRARDQDSTLLLEVKSLPTGKRVLVRAAQPGPIDTLDYMSAADTTSASAVPLAGTYVNVALGITWSVRPAGSRLVIEGAGNHYLPIDSLAPVGHNTYVHDQLTVRFIRSGRGRATGLIAAMPRMWNVRLARQPDREKVARVPQP